MRTYFSWSFMLIVGVLFMIMGFQGSLGKVLACLVTPAEVVVNTN